MWAHARNLPRYLANGRSFSSNERRGESFIDLGSSAVTQMSSNDEKRPWADLIAVFSIFLLGTPRSHSGIFPVVHKIDDVLLQLKRLADCSESASPILHR